MQAEGKQDFDPARLVRPAIARLRPYSSARDEFSGAANIFLDANENSLGSPTEVSYNRYPDPYQRELKSMISDIENIPENGIFIGNGSDEVIDLLFRVFCEPRTDNCIVCPPTYGMYEVLAGINDVGVRRVPLIQDFELDPSGILREADERTKLIFICSPNNPTGNSFDQAVIASVADVQNALIVLDEAYIHFSSRPSVVREISERPNIVVLRTFSKAWGLAGLRLGLAVCDPRVVTLLNKVKPPYNVSAAAQREALAAIGNERKVRLMVEEILELRSGLRSDLENLAVVERVFPSDANFLLAKLPQPEAVYRRLVERGIVVRDRSRVHLCEGCLRITVGSAEENRELVAALTVIGEEIL